MKSRIRLVLALCACTGAFVFAPFTVHAQNAPGAPATNPPPKAQLQPETKKSSGGPFHGKLAGVDLASRTIKVGKRTFLATAETKIQKLGKPAKLEDGVVGEPCSGYIKPDEHGRLIARSINFGPKVTGGSTPSTPKPREPKQPKATQPQ